MHREPVNQGELNASNFITLLVVAAIVFFLAVHPYNSAYSAPSAVGHMIAWLFVP